MKYQKGIEGLKESDLRDLWYSVDWIHMGTTYWSKLLNALGNSDVINLTPPKTILIHRHSLFQLNLCLHKNP